MRKIILTTFIVIISLNGFCQLDSDSVRNECNKRTLLDTINGVYIPKNLDDCFKQIDNFWSDSTKNMVKSWTENEFLTNTHFGFGMWIRNNWYLWGGSRLSKYFNDMGIFHSDDMSSIILKSYYRYLTGEKIKLKKQIKDCKSYWKSSQKPLKSENKFRAKDSYNEEYSSLDSALIDSDNIVEVRIIGYKKIPSKIRKFKNLNQLTIVDCPDMNFYKTIKFLSNFQNLTQLYFFDNSKNSYPKNLGKLVKLENLWFAGDAISFLPDELKDLINLKELYITECPEINLDILFNQLTNLVNLEELTLWDNDLTAIPFSISKLTQLKDLSFDENSLTEIPEGVKLLYNLEFLDLAVNQIESLDLGPNDLPNLKFINLGNNNFNTFPMELSHLKKLRTILIWDNDIDEVPDDIKNMNLSRLNLQGNNLTDEQKEKLKILLPNTKLEF